GQMRRERRDQAREGAQRLLAGGLDRRARAPGRVGLQEVQELVQPRDAGVEAEAVDRLGDLLDQLVGGAADLRVRVAGHGGRLAVELLPDAVDEAPGTLDATGGPLDVALGRAVRQREQARRVD